MSYLSLLVDTCQIEPLTTRTNVIGEVVRDFGDAVEYPCRLHSQSGLTDLEFGKVFEENQYLLYLPANAVVTVDHRIRIDAEDYKVTRVAHFKAGQNRVHHIEAELEKLG